MKAEYGKARQRAYAVAEDGSLVIGGLRRSQVNDCSSQEQGFIVQRTADGREVWRRSADLFAGLTAIDAEHIIESAIEDLAIDRATGEIFAIAKVLVGWQGEACSGGASTARGTLVLRLDDDGALLHDTYLGLLPAGPPPSRGRGCQRFCPPERWPQRLGEAVTVAGDGSVTIRGRSLAPRVPNNARWPEAEAFVTQLSHDLSPLEDPFDAAGFDKAGIPVPSPSVACSVGTHIATVIPLDNTLFESASSPSYLSTRDACTIRISHHPDGQYGVDIVMNLPPPISLPLMIDLSLTSEGEPMKIEVLARRIAPPLPYGRFVSMGTLASDTAGLLDGRTEIVDPLAYIENDQMTLRLRAVPPDPPTGEYCDDLFIDKVDCD
ncbi:MAG: hypothetical protein AAF657_17040 [Acidobacteriota bacterium]